MFFKRLMSKYGAIFTVSFFAVFIILVTLRQNFGSGTTSAIPGDIFINLTNDKVIFLPFTSSLAAAGFVTVMYQAYTILKSY